MTNPNKNNQKSTLELSISSLLDHLADNYKAELSNMTKGLIYFITRKEVCLLHYVAEEQDVLDVIKNVVGSKLDDTLLEFHIFNAEQEYRCLVSSRGKELIPNCKTRIIEHFVSDQAKGYDTENIDLNSFCDTVLLEKRVSNKLGEPLSAYLKVINYFNYDSKNGMLKINDYRLVCNEDGLPFTVHELSQIEGVKNA